MGPRADFSCLSKKCRDESGAAPVYADLPLKTSRCPVCGSKRVTRLFNSAPMVNTGETRRTDAFVQSSLDAAERPRLQAAPQTSEEWGQRRIRSNFAVKPEHLGTRLAEYGMPGAGALSGRIGTIARTRIQPAIVDASGAHPAGDAAPVRDPLVRGVVQERPHVIGRYDGPAKPASP